MNSPTGTHRNIVNSLAIIFEQGVKIAFGMYVGFYLVRHLGPSGYGELSLGMSIAALTGSIARLGLDGVALRTMAQEPERKAAVQAASFQILFLASLCNLLVLYCIEQLWLGDSVQSFLLPIIGASVAFQTVSVMDWGQQLARRSGVSAAVRTASSVVANIGKLLVIFMDGGVLHVALVTSAENLVSWIIYTFLSREEMRSAILHKFRPDLWTTLMKGGAPMLVTLFATSGYSKVDHLFISRIYDNALLGEYAAAIKIFDSWVVLPYMLTTQFIPALVAARGKEGYTQKVAKLYLAIVVMSVLFCAPMMIFPDAVVKTLYGAGYAETGGVLPLVMYAAGMASVISFNTRVLVSEGLERVVAVRAVLTLAIMALLSYPLIESLALAGAAMSLCLALTFSAYLYDYIPGLGGVTLRAAKAEAIRLTWWWRKR